MGERPTEENTRERAERYETTVAPLLRPLLLGAYHGHLRYHLRIWSWCLKRLIEAAGDQPTGQVFTIWDDMRYYPGLLGLYAVGSGAIAGGNAGAVARILRALHFDNELLRRTRGAIEGAVSMLLPGGRPGATSSWLLQRLSGIGEAIVASEQLVSAFDQFEYSLGLVLADEALGGDLDGTVYVQPVGWWFRKDLTAPWSRPDACMVGPTAKQWLSAGFFGSSAERLGGVKQRYDGWTAEGRMRTRLGFP